MKIGQPRLVTAPNDGAAAPSNFGPYRLPLGSAARLGISSPLADRLARRCSDVVLTWKLVPGTRTMSTPRPKHSSTHTRTRSRTSRRQSSGSPKSSNTPAGRREVELVGTCEKLEDPDAAVWSSVHLENVEAIGAGTLAYDNETDSVLPHIHISVGLKTQAATAHTSHLLNAKVHLLTEMYLVEVAQPAFARARQPALYDVPLL